MRGLRGVEGSIAFPAEGDPKEAARVGVVERMLSIARVLIWFLRRASASSCCRRSRSSGFRSSSLEEEGRVERVDSVRVFWKVRCWRVVYSLRRASSAGVRCGYWGGEGRVGREMEWLVMERRVVTSEERIWARVGSIVVMVMVGDGVLVWSGD